MSRSQQPRTQTHSLDEKYKEYLISMGWSADLIFNPFNLFSDYNQLDKAWFNFAKTFMSANATLRSEYRIGNLAYDSTE